MHVARAALGVVEDLAERRHQLLRPDAFVQLEQPAPADPAGGQLGAQVGPALLGLAHLAGELGDRLVVEHAR